MPSLNSARKEKFAQNLAKGQNQTEAAKNAGYSAKASAQTGSMLAKDPKIKARIDELLRKVDEDFALLRIIDKNSVLQGITELINKARADNKLGDALRGYELLGKHLRLWDRAAESINWNGDIGSLSEEQLDAVSQYFERIAFGGDKVKIEAARQAARIEAGIIDVVAETAPAEEAPKAKDEETWE